MKMLDLFAGKDGWGNLPILLANDLRFPNRILSTTRECYYAKKKGVKALVSADFAMIPYPIARFVCNCVEEALKMKAE